MPSNPLRVTRSSSLAGCGLQLERTGADAEAIDLGAVLLRHRQHDVGELRALRRRDVAVAAERARRPCRPSGNGTSSGECGCCRSCRCPRGSAEWSSSVPSPSGVSCSRSRNLPKTLDLPRVQLDQQRQLLRLVAVVRDVVPRLVEAEVDGNTSWLASRFSMKEKTRVRSASKASAIRSNITPACSSHAVGNADRRRRQQSSSRGRLLLGALDARFDLAHVLQVLRRAARGRARRGRARARRRRRAPSRGCCGSAACRAHALRRPIPGRPNMRSNTTRGLVSHRHRRRRRLPRDGVHVGAAVADVAGADVAGQVLGRRSRATGTPCRGRSGRR